MLYSVAGVWEVGVLALRARACTMTPKSQQRRRGLYACAKVCACVRKCVRPCLPVSTRGCSCVFVCKGMVTFHLKKTQSGALALRGAMLQTCVDAKWRLLPCSHTKVWAKKAACVCRHAMMSTAGGHASTGTCPLHAWASQQTHEETSDGARKLVAGTGNRWACHALIEPWPTLPPLKTREPSKERRCL